MSDLYENYDFDNEVALDPDEKNAGGTKQEWLKMSDGEIVRCAFVYFHTYDVMAVRAALKKAKKSGQKLTRENLIEIGKAALAKRASDLGKPVEQLTLTDKLDTSVTHFKMTNAHYSPEVGYAPSRIGLDGPEADAIWKRLPAAKTYFSTLLLVYPTDKEGNLNKPVMAEQVKSGKLKFVPWRFSPKTYDSIWKLNAGLIENGLTLASQDIQLECKDATYQNISIAFVGMAIWQKNELFKDVVLSGAAGLYDKLTPFRDVSTDKLREKLGMSAPVPSGDVSTEEFNNLLNDV